MRKDLFFVSSVFLVLSMLWPIFWPCVIGRIVFVGVRKLFNSIQSGLEKAGLKKETS
jgi:hypothetical protein